MFNQYMFGDEDSEVVSTPGKDSPYHRTPLRDINQELEKIKDDIRREVEKRLEQMRSEYQYELQLIKEQFLKNEQELEKERFEKRELQVRCEDLETKLKSLASSSSKEASADELAQELIKQAREMQWLQETPTFQMMEPPRQVYSVSTVNSAVVADESAKPNVKKPSTTVATKKEVSKKKSLIPPPLPLKDRVLQKKEEKEREEKEKEEKFTNQQELLEIYFNSKLKGTNSCERLRNIVLQTYQMWNNLNIAFTERERFMDEHVLRPISQAGKKSDNSRWVMNEEYIANISGAFTNEYNRLSVMIQQIEIEENEMRMIQNRIRRSFQ